MAHSASGRIIDRVIAAGVADWFRAEGFTRRGRSFCRRSGELFHTANVQASWLNRPQEALFAVNLGVEWPHFHRVWTGLDSRPNPAIAPTFIEARLHPEHTPANGDHWWRANPDTEPDRVGAEVIRALRKYGSEFWVGHSDLAAVLARFDAGEPVPTGIPNRRLVHAALLVRAGRLAEAQAIIVDAARRAPKGAGAGVQQVADRLGLAIGAV